MMSLAVLNRWISPSPLTATGEEHVEAYLALGVPRPLALLLVQRGFGSPAEANAALTAPLATGLVPAAQLPDIDVATRRIVSAIERQESIVVFGDYDCDGVCSTAILTRALQLLGACVTARVPNRLTEGRDLTPGAVARCEADGTTLIITIDCGTQAFDGAAAARAASIDLIIVDHHQVGLVFPDSLAFVNPQRADSAYQPADVCAALLAFKVALSVYLARGRAIEDLRWALDLVAIATLGDKMPLIGENRAIVKHAIRALPQTTLPGLQALLQVAYRSPRELSARDVVFDLVPRLNAPGRMDSAQQAVDLLLATNATRAAELANFATMANDHRRTTEERVLAEARRALANAPETPVIVLHGASWHPGVVSIAAARLAEQFGRPAIIVVGTGPVLRGSARATSGGNVHALFSSVRHLVRQFGGHPEAVGFELDADQLVAFGRAVQLSAEPAEGVDVVQALHRIDAPIALSDLTPAFAAWLDRMGPFGQGMPTPTFLLSNVEIVEVSCVGPHRNHLSGYVRAVGASVFDAKVRFFAPRMAEQYPAERILHSTIDALVAVEPQRDGLSIRLIDLQERTRR
jgi:single-stranded-DNA-specific exonuclease